MDLLAQYNDDDNEGNGNKSKNNKSQKTKTSTTTQSASIQAGKSLKKIRINAAPDVDITNSKVTIYQDPHSSKVYFNPKYQSLFEPVQGPVQAHTQFGFNPMGSNGIIKEGNMWTGKTEDYNMNNVHFDNQFNTYMNRGYAINPNGDTAIGDANNVARYNGALAYENNKNLKEKKKELKRKRISKGDALTDSYVGPWAGYEGEDFEYKAKISDDENDDDNNDIGDINDNDNDKSENNNEKNNNKYDDRDKNKVCEDLFTEDNDNDKNENDENSSASLTAVSTTIKETSIFHPKEFRDYQGRTFITPPSELKVPAFLHCYLPKKRITTWAGHNKGVNAIKFFPKYGHLILSAGLDGKVKVWDVYNKKRILRTYNGHTKGVRDVCFSNDGRQFLTASYDKYLKLWDTETGDCIGRFTNDRIPFCVKFYPENNNEFIAGCADKKIIQWDIRENQIVQQYDRHLGSVNTVTFVEDNKRFVSTSDDKSIRVWEYGIPVDIKYISEPHMHSMPSVAVHPNGKWMACQSLDNQILVYGARDKFKMNNKKRFSGHTVAGFACEVGFSPDGNYVISGSSGGSLYIWDWKTCKIYKKLQCHEKTLIGCIWHPIEPSRVATCGWDARIHYWD